MKFTKPSNEMHFFKPHDRTIGETLIVSTTIPANFPFAITQSSLAGVQPKIALVNVEGKYYAEGCTPEQQLEQYLMCEDLAHQSLAYCLRKIEDGTVADPNAAMQRLYSGLKSKNWCTQQQKIWIVNRVAVLGNWSNQQL